MPFYTHDNTLDSPLNNFATLNPLSNNDNLSNGNLTVSTSKSG